MESAQKLQIPFGTLRTGAQFQAVYSQGQRYHTAFFSAFILPTDTGEARLGITVSRKVGKAVIRNLCKRRVRQIFRHHQPLALPNSGFDIVINAKREVARVKFDLLVAEFQKTLLYFQSFLNKRALNSEAIELGCQQ
jgi:ribonuclease P protein component